MPITWRNVNASNPSAALASVAQGYNTASQNVNSIFQRYATKEEEQNAIRADQNAALFGQRLREAEDPAAMQEQLIQNPVLFGENLQQLRTDVENEPLNRFQRENQQRTLDWNMRLQEDPTVLAQMNEFVANGDTEGFRRFAIDNNLPPEQFSTLYSEASTNQKTLERDNFVGGIQNEIDEIYRGVRGGEISAARAESLINAISARDDNTKAVFAIDERLNRRSLIEPLKQYEEESRELGVIGTEALDRNTEVVQGYSRQAEISLDQQEARIARDFGVSNEGMSAYNAYSAGINQQGKNIEDALKDTISMMVGDDNGNYDAGEVNNIYTTVNRIVEEEFGDRRVPQEIYGLVLGAVGPGEFRLWSDRLKADNENLIRNVARNLSARQSSDNANFIEGLNRLGNVAKNRVALETSREGLIKETRDVLRDVNNFYRSGNGNKPLELEDLTGRFGLPVQVAEQYAGQELRQEDLVNIIQDTRNDPSFIGNRFALIESDEGNNRPGVKPGPPGSGEDNTEGPTTDNEDESNELFSTTNFWDGYRDGARTPLWSDNPLPFGQGNTVGQNAAVLVGVAAGTPERLVRGLYDTQRLIRLGLDKAIVGPVSRLLTMPANREVREMYNNANTDLPFSVWKAELEQQIEENKQQ